MWGCFALLIVAFAFPLVIPGALFCAVVVITKMLEISIPVTLIITTAVSFLIVKKLLTRN